MVRALDAALRASGVTDDQRGSITLAVAEALNNICEHAYGKGAAGPVSLTATLAPEGLEVILRDSGGAMPGGALPRPRSPDPSVSRDSLPEGGFGWPLMHKLCSDISYNRNKGQNTLILRFEASCVPLRH